MPVSRYSFKIIQGDGFLDIPLDMTFQQVDQCEVIDKDFTKPEVNKSINVIQDYEKVRLTPYVDIQGEPLADKLTYKLIVYDKQIQSFITPTYYDNIGINDDDLKFRKNALVKSSLILNFYDSPEMTNQRLISRIIIHPKILYNDTLLDSANKEVSFSMLNPLSYLEVFGEGFFIYHYKDELDYTIPKELYMRATFNNAKNGVSTNFMSSNQTNLSIDTLVNPNPLSGKLHTKYELVRRANGYYYFINQAYSNNVQTVQGVNGLEYIITLHEIVVT